jgi:hypothetical protein
MPDPTNISSEDELLQLRNEGRISEREYSDLLAAMRKPSPPHSQAPAPVRRKHLFWAALFAIIAAAVVISLFVVTFAGKSRTIDLAIADNGLRIRPESKDGLYFVLVSIVNRGRTVSPEFPVFFYCGDPNQVEPRTHYAGPIEPGDVWNERTEPLALKEGVSQILVVLDPYDKVPESDEANNCASLKIVVNEGRIIETDVNSPVAQ